MPRTRKPKPLVAPAHPPLEVIRRAVDHKIDSAIVYLSGGKDSVVTLDLCRSHFSRVEAVFMYFVPGLSFQETYLRYLERRYSLSVLRIPHWGLSHLFRSASFRHSTAASSSAKLVKIRDVDAYIRRHFNIDYIATGEKACDSLERRTQIVQCDALNHSRRRIYPIAWWTHNDVMSYLDRQQILPSPEYRITWDKKSFGSLWSRQILPIAEHYPDDYAKIKKQFPMIDAQVQRWRQMQGREDEIEASELLEQGADNGEGIDEEDGDEAGGG